jgi:hypothetical protein
MLKGFLLWFKRHNCSFYCTTSEDDVLLLKKSAFDEYLRSEEYAEDIAAASISETLSSKMPPGTGAGVVMRERLALQMGAILFLAQLQRKNSAVVLCETLYITPISRIMITFQCGTGSLL